jgi:uncharacterized protein (DUF427 family)
VVADTLRPVLVWDIPHYPTYYLPVEDVSAELVDTGQTKHSPSRGDARVHDVKIGDLVLPAAALTYPASPFEELRGLVRLEWDAMGEWLEEDEPVYTHARDPYKRVDILGSSRHVQVSVDGVRVADSRQPRVLYETSLPARYYLPMTDVRLDLLRPSTLQTHCPYKGTASYWDVVIDGTVHDGLVWGYRSPLPESQKIAGLIAFYNEKVDLVIDDVPQERPRTVFS